MKPAPKTDRFGLTRTEREGLRAIQRFPRQRTTRNGYLCGEIFVSRSTVGALAFRKLITRDSNGHWHTTQLGWGVLPEPAHARPA